jgi:transposase
MDAIETLRQEVQDGRISIERLVDLIASQQRQLQAAHQHLQAAQQRIDELEKKLGGPPPTAKLDEPFSMRSEEQRQEARGKKQKPKRKGRRGRFKTMDKIAQAERAEAVFPEGIPPDECHLSHVRPVWRLENRRAVLIAYQIYRGRNGQYQ